MNILIYFFKNKLLNNIIKLKYNINKDIIEM